MFFFYFCFVVFTAGDICVFVLILIYWYIDDVKVIFLSICLCLNLSVCVSNMWQVSFLCYLNIKCCFKYPGLTLIYAGVIFKSAQILKIKPKLEHLLTLRSSLRSTIKLNDSNWFWFNQWESSVRKIVCISTLHAKRAMLDLQRYP